MDDEFRDFVKKAVHACGKDFETSSEQNKALYEIIVNKRDTFVILPTGSGKSITFQLIPKLYDIIQGKDDGIVVLVCPLVSLLKSHLVELNSMGISACILGHSKLQ